jgi:membrane-associated protein
MSRLGLLLSGGSVAGLGAPVALGLLVLMEAGAPIPVPSDLVMLLVGERVADHHFPLWAAVLSLEAIAVAGSAVLFILARGPGHALVERVGPRLGLTKERLRRGTVLLEQRGQPALALGRCTPGLRTVTVIAAGGSGISLRRALPPLALGASVFLQLHLVLGYFLGPAARRALADARGPALLVLAALLILAITFWLIRRGRRAGLQALDEAACPACLALGWALQRQRTLSDLS